MGEVLPSLKHLYFSENSSPQRVVFQTLCISLSVYGRGGGWPGCVRKLAPCGRLKQVANPVEPRAVKIRLERFDCGLQEWWPRNIVSREGVDPLPSNFFAHFPSHHQVYVQVDGAEEGFGAGNKLQGGSDGSQSTKYAPGIEIQTF